MILAAGFGTRLLPLTRETPKPLLPIWNVPNLGRILAMLRGWGVCDVLVNVHHRADRLVEHLRTRAPDGLRIAISFEPTILGTGGALRRAEWFLAGSDPFWLINGDVVMDLASPRAFLRAYDSRKTIAAAWVHGGLGPRTVEVRRGSIIDFHSPKRGQPGTYTFCGVQLVNPRLLDRERSYVSREPAFESVIKAYQRARLDGWRVAGVEVNGSFWADIGTPSQMLDCHRALAGGRDFAAVHPSASVHPLACVRNSVVCENAVLGPRARVENAVIAPGARVNGVATYMALPVTAAFDAGALRAVKAWAGDPTRVTALPMGPRGSSRSYSRIVNERNESAILVHYDPARVENTYHAGHTRFLRRLRIPVPRLLVDRPADAVAIFEDLGDESLLAWQRGRSRAELGAMYRSVLGEVVRFHESGVRAARREHLTLMPAFRPTLYRWERNYFAEEMLVRREGRSPEYAARIKRELAGIARRLAAAPPVLVHRDLQSSNILIQRGRPWFIDYQGMRFGPAVYDLASLLCDPYVELDDALIGEMMEYYTARSSTPDVVRALFWAGAVQRLVQALGAFAKLGAQPYTSHFANHIPAAKRMLARALRETPGCAGLRAWCEG